MTSSVFVVLAPRLIIHPAESTSVWTKSTREGDDSKKINELAFSELLKWGMSVVLLRMVLLLLLFVNESPYAEAE